MITPRISCELPDDEDLDWMETAIQRHTGGFPAWWAEARDSVSGRELMRAIISIWEAGRGAKKSNFPPRANKRKR